ncbi:glycoside hydrolase family 2 TIM barrel-domain containing protein [Pseudoduganella albidiflava]|nr:glycoside hydrolase family 2 TIM barrel-domain containing protein [Pseudoduganella albidiflava]
MQHSWGAAVMVAITLSAGVPSPAMAAPASVAKVRTEAVLDQGWRFLFRQDGSAQPGAADPAWQAVTLPHTWNRIGGHIDKAPGYDDRRGQGWYQLDFKAPAAAAKPRRSWLQFDGASIVTDVWLNGSKVGTHRGGVSGFRFDVSDHLRPGTNRLMVRTDNTAPETKGSATAETLPMGGDWFMFGGLYRKVSLVTSDPLHLELDDHGGPGVYARTLQVGDSSATVEVVARVRNDTGKAEPATVRYALLDAAGAVVASASDKLQVRSGASEERKVTLTVPNPRLWNGRADPYLYRLKVDVLAAGRVRDTVTRNFGIRTMRFDPDGGFFLNGKRLALHGVNRHQESGANGWAGTDEELARDYALITEIGANTVRLAHYQHAQAEYDLADRLGLVVWAEIPLVNLTAPHGMAAATPAFIENAETHLRELIRQNHHHPSIAAWSIANEPNLMGLWSPLKPATLPLLRRLAELSRDEDPSRPAVLASCCGTIPGETTPGEKQPGLDAPPEAVDVFGVNVYAGWYYGTTGDLGKYLDRVHAHYPAKSLSVTEYGAGGGLTQHSDNPLGGPVNAMGRPHPEQFQAHVHETSWPQLRDRHYLWGTWLWNMFDFSSPSRQEGDLTDTNNKGIVSFDRSVRKEAFYFYKAHWNPEPMLYLAGHRYTRRAIPFADVKAYSNAAEARLTVNGRDLGTAACIERVCRWRMVALAKGDNVVEVSASLAGRDMRDRAVWQREEGPDTYRILAGQVAVTDTAAGLHGSDDFFTGGEGQLLNRAGFGKRPNKVVGGAQDQGLYQAWRTGDFHYDLPLPDGEYALTLRFVEPDEKAGKGQRVFDVVAGGKVVLENVDIAAEAGTMVAHERIVPITVQGGMARIGFVSKKGKAIVSAISVAPR